MSENRFSLEIKDNSLVDALNRLSKQFSPREMRPVMNDIGAHVLDSVKERFYTQKSPEGTPWEELSFFTKKARLHGVAKRELPQIAACMIPLVATCDFAENSFSFRITDGGASVEIGTNHFTNTEDGGWKGGAGVHQFGSKDGRIPARPFLGLSDGDERAILKIIRNFVENATRR